MTPTSEGEGGNHHPPCVVLRFAAKAGWKAETCFPTWWCDKSHGKIRKTSSTKNKSKCTSPSFFKVTIQDSITNQALFKGHDLWVQTLR